MDQDEYRGGMFVEKAKQIMREDEEENTLHQQQEA
jgi:hypothetical protein